MAISFNNIPISIRVPGVYVEIDNSRAYQGLFALPTRLLIIGQRLATSPLPALTLERVTRPDQAAARAGAASQLGQMAVAALTASDWVETWMVGVDDDAAAVAATGTVTIGGAPTSSGTLVFYVGGRRLQIAVASGAATATVATDLAAAINARSDLAVTAAAVGSVVTATARNGGACGNAIDLRHSYYSDESLPAGLTVTVAAMSGGTGNPDITPVLDLIGDEWFTDIVTPWTDAANLGAVEAKAAENFGPMRMLDAHVWAGASGSFSALTTLGNSRNSPHLTIMGAQRSPTPPWEWAAVLAATSAYYLSIDPARPLQTLELKGILPPSVEDRFIMTERDQLLRAGIATFRATRDGLVAIERAVTTYQTNVFGAVDPSYLDVEPLRTLALLRFDLRNLIALRFPRHKLASDGTNFSLGQAVATPRVIRAEIIARFRKWEEQGLAENIDQFKQDLIVERDANDPNRVNALIPPDIVNQLRVVAGQIQFRL